MKHFSISCLTIPALLLCLCTPALGEEAAEEANKEAAQEAAEKTTEKTAEKKSGLAARFASSSVLVEHSFSIAHGLDLSPEYTRTISRTLLLSPAFEISPNLSVAAQLGLSQELTVTDTTFPYEPLLDDLKAGVSVTLPQRKGAKGSLSARTGMDLVFPTSKASLASSLIMAFEPWLEVALGAPLLDGLEFSYRLTPNPRVHRYSTASLRVARPCSPAAGCSLGASTDTGDRNTALQLHNDFALSLSLLDSKLSFSAQLTLSYGLPYPKSPSPRFEESILSDPANDGGSPVRLNSSFIFDISYQVHPGIGLSVGLWTPGGMQPDGGWYNPLGNRNSQIYLDVTIYPVALVQAGLKDWPGRKNTGPDAGAKGP